MKISVRCDGLRHWHEAEKVEVPPADMQIVTSDGHRIAAHSHLLASASPVLESLVYEPRKRWDSERVIHVLGVSSDVVFAFLHFVYSSREMALSSTEGKEAMDKYGVQLMVLAHKYRISWLKTECQIHIVKRLKPESVIDVLQIARLCDATRLHQSCLSLIAKEFATVQKSDGWRFVQMNDPKLGMLILRFLEETDQRRKRWKRERSDQEMYSQLSEAMECLEHICTEGCTSVGPHDRPIKSEGPCIRYRTCDGLQLLIRHFASCGSKTCPHCKRMWQLFRLHSSLCHHGESCKVPLCKQFKLRMQMDGKFGDDATWRLLVKKVVVARAMCSLANRKRPDQLHHLPFMVIR